VPVFDAATGMERRAHVFVAVLGASNYTYAEARWSEGLADRIGAHVNALSAIGGAPKAIVCDNLKAGVTATTLRTRHRFLSICRARTGATPNGRRLG
jgi:transposase